MIGFNHATIGGLIGKFLPLPVALPLALASHFVLDSLPHYGMPHKGRDHSLFWKLFFTVDFFATFGLAVFAISEHRYAWFACGLVAVAPDFVWVARLLRTGSFDLSNNTNWYTKWHVKIQRYERPWGIYIEMPLAVITFYILFFR